MSFARRSLSLFGLFLCSTGLFATTQYKFVPVQAPEGVAPGEKESSAPGGAPVLPNGLTYSPAVPNGQGFLAEVEPNNTFATATPLGGTNVVVRANVYPNADADWYSFTGAIGDRIHAATQTSFSANASSDSQLRLYQPDGTTLIEFDENDGSIGALSSTIAAATLTAAGTHYLEVRHNSATNQLRPYDLHFRLQTGAPTAEVEPNNTPATATPIPASGSLSGSVNPAADGDFFSIALAAGDTVFMSLDIDPERDNVQWNGRLGMALFGTANNQILVVNDTSVGAVANPLSEAFFFTVKTAGTYYVYVDEPAAAGGATLTYRLSVAVHPHVDEGVNCTTYTSTNVPVVIPTGPGSVTSTLTIPGNPRIADLDLSIELNHTFIADLDFHLISPAGNDNGVATDIGPATVGGAQTTMNVTFDDEAAIPSAFAVAATFAIQPEAAYRLNWFDGENAGGTWTLQLRDDATGDGGNLTAWSLRVCEPAPPPACAPGFVPTTVFSTDFEAGDAGFTHSGTADEWERGLPATAATGTAGAAVAAFTTCNSGVNCWKTDLDNTYNNAGAGSVTQDLLSPNINLAGLSAPVVVTWAQRHQVENATFDHYFVAYQQAGGATPVRLFEWLDATPSNGVGNPTVNIGESSGWGLFSRRADSLAGLNTELLFHMDQDNSVALAGVAIDDVSVTACRPLAADLSITKTDNVTSAVPGGQVTYTIVATNNGPDPANPVTVADTFPVILTCSTTSVAAGGATGNTPGPFGGNINDTALNMPTGSTVTYTSVCTISPAATGSLSNTATVSVAAGDPDPTDNSATDTDTLTPQTDLVVTKTDGVTTAVPGGSTTYTIMVTNAGPSNAVGVTMVDTFPAACTSVNFTSSAAGGATGNTAAGSGNINDTLAMPAGSSVTYLATCNISPAATGSLFNSAAAGVATDPDTANNTGNDTDTLTPQADLAITKTDGLTTANAGDPLTYTIVVSNSGLSDVTGATVIDNFPAGYTVTGWTCSGALGGTCTPAGAGNINDIVNLPAGASVTYTVNGTANAAGTLTNTATVGVPAGTTDPNPANNSATDNTDIASPASLSATKTVSGDFVEGGAISYTIVITNAGPAAQLDNPTDEFADVLPASLTLTNVTATSGTASFVGNTASWNGSIPAGGSVTITIDATINAGTLGTTISNQGTVYFDADGNGTNESSTQTDDPVPPGSADPTDFVVGSGASVLEIPTLSMLGAAALGIALAALSLLFLRRRRAG